MESCFDHPDYWHDWPATVFAEYLLARRGRDAAVEFAHRYVTTLRREIFPPPDLLRDLCAAAEAHRPAPELVAS